MNYDRLHARLFSTISHLNAIKMRALKASRDHLDDELDANDVSMLRQASELLGEMADEIEEGE